MNLKSRLGQAGDVMKSGCHGSSGFSYSTRLYSSSSMKSRGSLLLSGWNTLPTYGGQKFDGVSTSPPESSF